jgi:hypothetical protein
MIDLTHDQLLFKFPEVHADASLTIEFQRTLRIPEGEREFPLLPGLGRFPLFPVRALLDQGAAPWLNRVEAMLPMYQSEAMWLSFRPSYSVAHETFYPFAVKIRSGPSDAISGRAWSSSLHRNPQDYLVLQEQSWLGGYSNGHGLVHQFVAVPFGNHEVARKDATNRDNWGRIQIDVLPMTRRAFDHYYPTDSWKKHLAATGTRPASDGQHDREPQTELAPQQWNRNPFCHEDWDRQSRSTYSIHLANSLQWCAMTGSPPPTPPLSASLATAVSRGNPAATHLGSRTWRALKGNGRSPLG